MSDWSKQVRSQARLVIDQIAVTRTRLLELGVDQSDSLNSYYAMLENLFSRDLALADVRDNSDLVIRVEGNAFDQNPRLQLVTSVFENVTNQVTDLTKAILGLWADGRVTPAAIDLGVTGIARGSLILGLSANPQKRPRRGELLGEHDTIVTSTKKALKIIDEVAHAVYKDPESVSVEEVSHVVADPKVRDAALVALQRIAPSGRRGIDTVSVSAAADRKPPAELTVEHRRAIRQSLFKPVIRGDEIQFQGNVREIDLDARRFDLRGIANEQVRDVRCAYRDVPGVNPKHLLGATVRVRGLVERADEVPRLMSVLDLEIIRAAPEHPV